MNPSERMTELIEDTIEEFDEWEMEDDEEEVAESETGLSLDEWRRLRTEGEDAELPSRLVVQLRRVSMLDLAEQGQIPTTLKPKLNALIRRGRKMQMDLDKLKEFIEVVNLVCAACIVGPQGLKVTELPYEDRIAIFNWANQFSGRLQPFRG
jgi:hypothetical protein